MTEKNNYTSEPSFKKFFKRPEKPSTIKSGQIWTVFPNNKSIFSDNPENTGTVVLIYEASDESAFIVPIHPYKYLRPKTDIIIKKDVHFSGLSSNELVASIHLALSISITAFEYGVYLGEFTKKGMIETKDALKNFENILFHLALAQRKDSRNELMTDEESRNTVLAGIYDLVPVDGNLDDLIAFNNQIKDILQPWHVLAMAEMFAEEEEKTVPENSFFQKVAAKIVVFVLYLKGDIVKEKQPEYFPAAAGEASKADHKIPVKINVDGHEEEIDIILQWDDRNDVTKIKLEGDCVSRLCHEKIEIEVHFENKDVLKHQFNNEENFIFRMPLIQSTIVKIILKRK